MNIEQEISLYFASFQDLQKAEKAGLNVKSAMRFKKAQIRADVLNEFEQAAEPVARRCNIHIARGGYFEDEAETVNFASVDKTTADGWGFDSDEDVRDKLNADGFTVELATEHPHVVFVWLLENGGTPEQFDLCGDYVSQGFDRHARIEAGLTIDFVDPEKKRKAENRAFINWLKF